MDRNNRRDDRSGRRDELRSQKPRYERERSRSPHHERRDDRRRSRSPPRGSRNGPSQRFDRASDRSAPHNHNPRGSRSSRTPEPSRLGGRNAPRDNHPHGIDSRGGRQTSSKPETLSREVQMGNGHEDEDSEAEMARVMGFKDFRSTKNTKVPGNDKNYAVSKVKKAEYRQYMNRVGGFNRPLSPGRG